MSSFSRKFEKEVLELAVGRSPEAERWIALCTSAPTKASTGSTIVEASYTGYKRVKTTHTSWEAASEADPSKILNELEIKFAECTAGESKCGYFAICSAETTGNVIGWGALEKEVTISTANTPASFAAKTLEVTCS